MCGTREVPSFPEFRRRIPLRLGSVLALALALIGLFPPTAQAREGGADSLGSAPAYGLRLGDAAPPLTADWLGSKPPLEWSEPGRTTIVIFWATWCPSSRAALPHLDSLAATVGRKARFVALSHESRSTIAAYAERARIRKIALGTDPQKRWAHDWMEPLTQGERRRPALPFAVIVGDDVGRGPGTILWAGPILAQESERPLDGFFTTVAKITSGGYSLEDAMAGDAAADRVRALTARLQDLMRNRPVGSAIDSLLLEFAREEARPEVDEQMLPLMNNLAWTLATREGRTPGQLAAATRAIDLAREHGGADDPMVLDTYAYIVSENGDRAKATEIQRRVVELSLGSDTEGPFRETLRRYQAAAGLPVDPDPSSESASPDSTEAALAWSGNLNQAGDASRPLPFMLVAPIDAADTAEASAWKREMQSLRERFYPQSVLRAPREVTEAERLSHNLVLYGSPSANPMTAEVLARADIKLDSEGVEVDGIRVTGADAVLIVALPNPWMPVHPLRVYAALTDSSAHNLNQFRHGGTSLVVGQWKGTTPEVGATLDLKARPRGGPETARLDIAPARLTPEQAVEDLRTLDSLLVAGYAGYPDLDWQQRASGGSWAGRTESFAREVNGRPEWPTSEFFDLLTRYLAPVQDHHFRMRFVGPHAGVVETKRAGFIEPRVPYFADVRVILQARERRLTGLPPELADAEGASLRTEIPLVGSPDDVAEGSPYLFPTLPLPEDPVGSQAYLLGCLVREETEPPPIEVRIKAGPGRSGSPRDALSLPLHRGRVGGTGTARGIWMLRFPPSAPLPSLAVGTMEERVGQKIVPTADTLRLQPAVLLDLRGNGGGTDSPAISWCRRFARQSFDWIASVQPRLRMTDPLRRYATRLGGRLDPDEPNGPPGVVAPEPYGGRLVILVDKAVASSGETFTQMAAQISGAVLVGENTAGCVDFGNVETKKPLPHSGILCAFGRTRFIEDWVRPSREGVGFFPDYWLDTKDPATEIARWLGVPAAEGMK